LLNELKEFNPELLDKQRVLAITKSDMLDEELMEAIEKELPEIKHVFISAVSGYNISQLKDLLWDELNDEANRVMTLSHRLPDNVVVHPASDENIEEIEDEEIIL